MLDSQLTMSTQVGAVRRSAYNYFRQHRPAVRILSVEARKTSPCICIFAPRLLQLCCSVLPIDSLVNVFEPHALSVSLVDASTPRQYWDDFTGNALSLRWPFCWCTTVQGTEWLVTTYVHDCQLITTTGHWRLRQSNVATCEVSGTRTSLSDRSFTAAGPYLWNNLPLHLRDLNYRFWVSPVTENAFVWLMIPAPTDYILDSKISH